MSKSKRNGQDAFSVSRKDVKVDTCFMNSRLNLYFLHWSATVQKPRLVNSSFSCEIISSKYSLCVEQEVRLKVRGAPLQMK